MRRDVVEVSVVLPAYNEEATIEETVKTTLARLAEFLPDDAFEVIIAEDGCEDRTPAIADRLAAEDARVRHFHSDRRLGRGGALERAFRESNGQTLVYFDTDLATDMSHLEELVESVRTEGFDVATGSRWIDGHEAARPARRGVPSVGYNTLVRLFLRSDLQDHQCGFKAFDRAVLFDLLPAVEDDHWFWDTEVLVRAQKRGYRVKEFPVAWTPQGDSSVDIVRDVFGMGSQILRTWWQLSIDPRITRGHTIAAGFVLTVVAVALMFVYLDPETVLSEMAAADPVLVAVSAVVYALSWPLRGIRYSDILSKIGYDERWDFLTGAIFISQTGNLVFPARAGDAVRAYVVKTRRGVPYPSGFASLAVERVFDLLTITFLAGTVFVTLAMTGGVAELATALFGAGGERAAAGQTAIFVATAVGCVAIVSVAVIVLTARSDRNLVRRGVSRLSSDSYAMYVAGVLERFTGDVQTVANDGRSFVRVGGTSLVIWTLDVVTAAIVLQAFHVGLSVPALVGVCFFAVSVGNLAKVLPLSPGGIGLYEGAFTILVVALTPIGAPVAFGAAVVDHAVKNVVTVAGGVISMLYLNVSLTRAVDRVPEDDTVPDPTVDD